MRDFVRDLARLKVRVPAGARKTPWPASWGGRTYRPASRHEVLFPKSGNGAPSSPPSLSVSLARSCTVRDRSCQCEILQDSGVPNILVVPPSNLVVPPSNLVAPPYTLVVPPYGPDRNLARSGSESRTILPVRDFVRDLARLTLRAGAAGCWSPPRQPLWCEVGD